MIRLISYISLIIIFITPLTMLVGCYNSANEPVLHTDIPPRTTTIANLKSHILGTRPQLIEEDVVIVGHVISSDREENFYRSIVVDDDTGAIEVMMGISPLAADYPEGLLLALRLKGCYVGFQRGVAVAGTRAPEYESFDIGYLASQEAIDRVVVRSNDVEIQPARTLHIAELQRSDCGRLICIDGVQLTSSSNIDTLQGETLHDARWAGYALFKDENGDSIAVYTRDYARFAEQPIPTQELSLQGILQWAPYNGQKECYQLKMRYAEDFLHNAY